MKLLTLLFTVYSLASMLVYHSEDEFGHAICDAFDSIPAPTQYETFALDKHTLRNMDAFGVQKRDSGLYKATYSHRLTATEVQKNALYIEQLLNQAAVRQDSLSRKIFVLVHDITYITDRIEADATKLARGAVNNFLSTITGSTTEKEIKDNFQGFKVINHSYLYQFDHNTDSLYLFFIGHVYDFDPKPSLMGVDNQAEYIRTQCARSIDRNILALGQLVEDFRTPIRITEEIKNRKKIVGYAVQAGTREGLQANGEYQVVEPLTDEAGVTTYQYIADVKIKKDCLWDNRYNAQLEQTPATALPYTTLIKVAGGDIKPGMILMEKKTE